MVYKKPHCKTPYDYHQLVGVVFKWHGYEYCMREFSKLEAVPQNILAAGFPYRPTYPLFKSNENGLTDGRKGKSRAIVFHGIPSIETEKE